MVPRTSFVVAVTAVIGWILSPATVRAQAAEPPDLHHTGVYVMLTYSGLSNPIFRGGFGSGEVVAPQSRGSLNFGGGYEFTSGRAGGGIRLSYARVSFDSIRSNLFPSDPSPNGSKWSYQDPSESFFFVDLIGSLIPDRRGMVGIHGILGMGRRTEKGISIADSPFNSGNGPRTIGEFVYSYGLAGSVSPHKRVAITGEFRLIPGDLTSHLQFLRTEGAFNVYLVTDEETKNYTRFLSVGASLRF